MSSISRSELLSMMLYGLDMAMRPTMGNLFNGDQAWRDYNDLHRGQFSSMQAAGLIERQGKRGPNGWAIKLTEAGRLRAIGGRDAPARWSRSWNGEWQFLIFDLDNSAGRLRQSLFRWLRSNDFGCLQQSVWITPDPVGDELAHLLRGFGDQSESILVLKSEITNGQKHRLRPGEIASKAWDFEMINSRYLDYLAFAKSGPPKRPTPAGARAWVSAEQDAWFRAIRKDPLLPDPLLPKRYLGKEAWAKRDRLLKKAAPMLVALRAGKS
ncbi:MAG: hypothetical protein ACR2RV_16165 [Verrucomicrobiales bacterium]